MQQRGYSLIIGIITGVVVMFGLVGAYLGILKKISDY